MTKSIKEQIEWFLEGFHEIIPRYLIAIFNEFQIELLISGVSEIDVRDWKMHTELSGYQPGDNQIVWFVLFC